MAFFPDVLKRITGLLGDHRRSANGGETQTSEPIDDYKLGVHSAIDWSEDPRRSDLRQVRQLEANAALVLKNHNGALLLWGLQELSPDVAQNLSHYRGCLDLRGLTSVSESVACALSTTAGYLNLSGLRSLPASTAAGLANHKGYLDLSGVEEISIEAARELVRYSGFLDLSGMSSISESASRYLVGARNGVNLNGLTGIDPGIAELLAQAGEILCLEGLRSLDEETAEKFAHGWANYPFNDALLSDDRRRVYFPDFVGNVSVTNGAATILLDHLESWWFGLGDYNYFAKEEESARQLVSIAQAIATARTGDNNIFRFIPRLTRSDAIALSRYDGGVSLNGLEELSVEVAEILAVRHELHLDIDFPNDASPQAIVCLWPYLDRNPWIPYGWNGRVAWRVLDQMQQR